MKKLLVLCASVFSLNAFAIDGEWRTDCEGANTYSGYYHLKFEETSMVSIARNFKKPDCESLAYEFYSKVTYNVGDAVEGLSANKYDLVWVSVHLVVWDVNQAVQMNRMNYCGIGNWKAGEVRDITGRVCSNSTMPVAGDKVYSLIRKGDDTLLFAQFDQMHDGKTEERRPIAINEEEVYKKVE